MRINSISKSGKKPRHCFIGYDYAERKCRDLECEFKGLCKRISKQLKKTWQRKSTSKQPG